MSTTMKQYEYLLRKPNSPYKQLYVQDLDLWLSARRLYCGFADDMAPQTAEELASGLGIPLEAVREAIAYCQSNPPEIAEDLARDEQLLAAWKRDHLRPADQVTPSTTPYQYKYLARKPNSAYKQLFVRSEERRVGKEGR